MVRRKKKTVRRKVPPNRSTNGRAYDDFAVVLENVYAAIGAVGESVDLLREQMKARFDILEALVRQLDKRLAIIEVKISQLEAKASPLSDDVAAIKHEIRLIRHDLTQKVNREEFEILAERVEKLEKELAVR